MTGKTASFAELMPDGAACHDVQVGEVRADLYPSEAAALGSGAVAKRRQEMAAGRFCARAAMAQLGVPAQALPPDRNRVPIWPDGLVGSITHSHGYAAAVVAPVEVAVAVGIDAESLPGPGGELMRLLATDSEQTWLLGFSAAEQPHARTLLFCAKEAAYKCVFPRTRQMVDFLQARVIVETRRLAVGTRGRYQVRFDPDTRAGPLSPVAGHFAIDHHRVLCLSHIAAK